MTLWHIPLWPFKKISDWLRRHFEKKQLQELIAAQERQYLLEIIPVVDVSVRLIRNPDPPRRIDIPIIDVTIMNYGGKTNIVQGHFWITLSDNPAYKEEKYLADRDMPKGKKEEFHFLLIRQFFDKVIGGQALLKFHYDLRFKNPNGQTEERKHTSTYNPKLESFISDN